MASRYFDNKIKKKGGVNAYETSIYEKVDKRNDDLYFTAQEGDRFDLLAHKFYGDASLWWYLAKANNLSFNNIPLGTVIRIPSEVRRHA